MFLFPIAPAFSAIAPIIPPPRDAHDCADDQYAYKDFYFGHMITF
jgi:hypothetical protein